MIDVGEHRIDEVRRGNDLYTAIYLGTEKLYSVATIDFADQAVKTLCVSNWGGNVVEGEITKGEAAAVTSLNGVFREKTDIKTFDELRFFTGLTTLSSVTSETYSGDFWNCTNLESITIPKANISSMLSAFHRCVKLSGTLDLSPLSPVSNIDMGRVVQSASNTNTLNVVVLPSGTYSSTIAMFARRTGLHTVSIDGIADFSGCSYASAFAYCSALEHITGTIVGIENNISFSDSPKLTRESLLVIINGLAQVATQKTLTLHATAKARLTEDDIAIATAKNWQIP